MRDTIIDDVIVYEEKEGVVYGYINQKALDMALYNRVKEKTNGFTDKDLIIGEVNKRAVKLDDISLQQHSVLFKPISDGEYVSKGSFILDLGLRSLSYGEYFRRNNISDYNTNLSRGIKIFSNYSGYFNNMVSDTNVGFVNLGNTIKDTDLLFTIRLAENASETINSINIREIKFDYSFLDKDFLEDVPYLSDISFTKWLIPDYTYVNAGDDVLIISEFTRLTPRYNQIIKAPYSGILVHNIQETSRKEKLCKGTPLFTLYNDKSSLVNDLFKYRFNVSKDDFTGSCVVNCEFEEKRFSILNNFYACSVLGMNMSSCVDINVEFVGGKYYLLLFYDKKIIRLDKNNSLLMLLDNGCILSLKPSIKPANGLCKYQLTDSDLSELEANKFTKWRIIGVDGEPLLSGNNNCCSHIMSETNESQRLSYDTFQRFIIDFRGIVRNNTPHEQLAETKTEELNSGEKPCYVYLMIDTTNNFHKIGISNNPKYREHTLQSDKPTIELVCAKEYPSREIAEAIESALHRVYASKRIRGEWFNLDETDIDGIRKTLNN